MTIDIYRIDSIQDYDEAIEALSEYVEELVDDFVESPEGEAYLKAYPEMEEYVGSWIDNLLYFGYAYESVTLPKMTKNSVEVIVTRLFPKKLSLFDPNEADTTIPELTAFWEFLKREYKHPKATQILKFLKQIQPKFKQIMNDPSNFGMAKSFFMAGAAAGFDMTTEEGLKAFQEQHNQNIQKSQNNSPLPSMLGELLSNAQPQGNVNSSLPEALQNLLQNMKEIIEEEYELSEETEIYEFEGEEEDNDDDYETEVQKNILHLIANKLPPLSPELITILKQQKITETSPGMILQDFQTLLDFIGEKGIAVSSKQNLLPLKSLAELNQSLSEPIQTNLKRPQQKSYPPINGLYLLLRASGIGQIVNRGKKPFLLLNHDLLSSWQKLNPTEKYCTLLETWLIRAHDEMLGERPSRFNEGSKCFQFWTDIPEKGLKIKHQGYGEQQSLSYYPGLHNLALMKLFGLIELESSKPPAGEGYRLKSVKKLPFGEALMQVIVRAAIEHGLTWKSEEISFGKLQPILQPYFPEWKNNLDIPEHEFISGIYIFKVSIGRVWRRIAIASEMTLADLSSLILESVDFDQDHLDMFTYKNQIGRVMEISHPYADDSPSTDEVRIGDLPLKEGDSMNYIFDFGDWWEFNIQLEKIEIKDSPTDYGAIIESHGKSPEQYPEWDEEEDYEDDDEE